jgi:SAM-dependent methyltransferase
MITNALAIPDSAIAYILFQRAYWRLPITPLYRFLDKTLPFQTPLYNLAIAVESRLGKLQIKARYDADMRSEYYSIRQALPTTCVSVLDIGCGVAGINAFIQWHYENKSIDFYLLDKTEVAKVVYYLFKPTGAFYNSLDVAQELLIRNGVPRHAIHTLEANTEYTIPTDASFDVVLSLLSWGFHYPVATYLETVKARLAANGVVILDVRKATDGLATLQRSFQQVDIIQETPKYHRVAARL